MTETIHALIHAFLQVQAATPLFSTERKQQDYQKSGIVPFIREEDSFSFFVMKPTSSRPGLTPPKWQLCKGTRMYCSRASGKWKDLRISDKVEEVEAETLVMTALREGHEELGLLPEMVLKLFDVGPYLFYSAKTGQEKHMWMFAAEVEARDVFLPASHVAATTADRCWLTADEFKVVGRDDHLYILEDIEAK